MVAATGPDSRAPAEDQSVAELVTELSAELRRLARAEAKLAVLEMRRKAKRAGAGAGLLGGAGVFALIGALTLAACAVLALALVWPAWLAALVVGVAAVAAAGMSALTGRAALRRAGVPKPVWAASSVREDVEAITKAVRR